MTKTIIQLDREICQLLFGYLDNNVRTIVQLTGVDVRPTQDGLELEGDNCTRARMLIDELVRLIDSKLEIDGARIRQVWDYIDAGHADLLHEMQSKVVAITPRGRKILAKTRGQAEYVRAIEHNTLVFGVGPAGSGKTYLAVAMAVSALKNKQVSRIILTRPAIEAGEKLGFLPGDLQQKVDPYLRPLYDALEEMTGADSYTKLIDKGALEIAPLAYMRGRTLSKAFIILDEAQNTTHEQMKMFLTRFGEGSRVVVTGDITQVDLPRGIQSGLVVAMRVLQDVQDIQVVRLAASDVVRHELVQRIVEAYAKET
jgi:phosphate starvation-inducible PhoH-like protein